MDVADAEWCKSIKLRNVDADFQEGEAEMMLGKVGAFYCCNRSRVFISLLVLIA